MLFCTVSSEMRASRSARVLFATSRAFAINSSGVSCSCPAMYPPFLRMDGRTSEVTQSVNFSALGSLEPNTRR